MIGSKKLVALLIGGVLVSWIGGWLSTIVLGWWLPPLSPAAYGPVGDMFGASNALFAGIGLIGVAVVLNADLRDRRRARRPLLLPQVPPEDKVELTRARWQDDQFDMSLKMSLTIENATAEPALNPVYTVRLIEPDISGEVTGGGAPFGSSTQESVSIVFAKVGEAGRRVLVVLQAGGTVEASIEIRYSAVNGAAWISRVVFELQCERTEDKARAAKILDRHDAEEVDSKANVLEATESLFLICRAKQGSWSQEAVA